MAKRTCVKIYELSCFSHMNEYNISRKFFISDNIPTSKMIFECKNQNKKGYVDIKAGRTRKSSVALADIRKNDIYDG